MDVRSWSLRCYRGKRGRRWFVDVLTDGKRIRAVIRQAKTKEEALELAPKIVEDIRRGNTPGDGSSPSVMEGSITLAGALEADNSRTGIAERTRQSEVNQAGHLSRILGAGKTILSLSHDDIETYKKHRQGDGVKPRTINLELQLLRAMLNRLLKANKISRVTVSISNLPEDDDGKVTKTLTKEERDLLIAECKSTPGLYDQVAFLVHTGLRRDELFSLRWGSVRLGAPRPSVTIAWKKRGAAGNYRTRVVPLNTVAAEIIERRARENPGRKPDDLVFGISAAARKRTGRYNGGRTGGIDCFRDHRLRTKLKKAAERAGITWAKDLRIHDLRHCCATLMLQGGASVVDVAAILGHSDPTLTLRLYGHAQEHTMRSAVEALCG